MLPFFSVGKTKPARLQGKAENILPHTAQIKKQAVAWQKTVAPRSDCARRQRHDDALLVDAPRAALLVTVTFHTSAAVTSAAGTQRAMPWPRQQ